LNARDFIVPARVERLGFFRFAGWLQFTIEASMTFRTRLLIFFLAALLLAPVLLSLPVGAATRAVTLQFAQAEQSVAAAVEALQRKVKGQLEEAALALEDIKTKVDAAAGDDATLGEHKVEADHIALSVARAQAELEARLALIDKRLEALGPAPAEGQAEDTAVATDRKRLQAEKAQVHAILADCEVIRDQAEDLSDHVTDLRRTLFAETIFRYTETNAELFENAGAAAVETWRSFVAVSSSSLEFMWRFKRQGLLVALVATAILGLLIGVAVRRLFGALIMRDPGLGAPHYLRRLSVAFWSATIPALAGGFVIVCAFGFLFSFNVLREELYDIFRAVAWSGLGVYYVWKLARGVVSPGKPQWRLLDLSDDGARRLVTFAVVLAAINGVSYSLATINVALDAPLVLTVVESFIASIATGFTLILLSFVRPLGSAGTGAPAWRRLLRLAVLLTGIALIVIALLGYVGLAKFVSSQIIVTGAILVTMYVGFLSGHAVSQHAVFAQTALGLALARRFGLGEIRLDQLGLAAGLLVHLAVLLAGIPMVMLTWGFTGADISALFVRVFTEIRVGNISISLLGILVGIALFIAGFFATRWFQGWLDGNVMARSQVDTGVRNSVNTVLGYTGIVLAALLGVSAAGFDLSSLALVAGALSLGIGFGLQTIVQNFVSGLILLVERPFKVGDWIVNGPVEGFVRRISVRATEIETFQNQSIIVPNSQLINAAVGNWTLRNSLARSEIPVSVSHDSDPKQVMELLLEIARSHPLVLTMPEPNVGFQAFGQFSLDFELRFHVADIFQGGPVRNDIRCAIIERFREEDIVMPLPTRDLNLRLTGSADILEDALFAEGLPKDVIRRIVERAEGGAARPRRGRKVDIADDEDGSPFDGMHHALRDSAGDDDDNHEESADQTR
jgi:potassium efflux system protein